MPGNVKTLDSAGMDEFPTGLYAGYAMTLERHLLKSEYADGSFQRASDVTTSGRKWRFTRKLTASQLAELRDFYFAHVGRPFLFSDLYTSRPNVNFDEMPGLADDLPGTMDDAKMIVVFSSAWSETAVMSRWQVSLELTEVA